MANGQVLSGLSWKGLHWASTATAVDNWHPLTWLSHMLDCELFGLRAGLHHLTSVWFHLANTVLVFRICERMTGAMLRSAAVAGLFAVHPLHVESVAWISERKDVLSVCFLLGALWFYLNYVRKPSVWQYLNVVFFFTCSLMSKPMGVTMPFLLLLLDVWPLGGSALGVHPIEMA